MECKDVSVNPSFMHRIIVLIETLWNVKSLVKCCKTMLHHRINRNIVECKGATAVTIHAVNHLVLIETLWNVKHGTTHYMGVYEFVLIETLWNVKVKQSIIFNDSETVLIETLWNVKQSEYGLNGGHYVCINRNIVECKVITSSTPSR